MEKINKNAIVGDKVRSLAKQILEGGNYDLQEEFTNEEIAEAVTSLSMALVGRGVNRELVLVPTPVSLFALGVDWKAQSGHHSWVSCSDENGTGISRSVTLIFSDPLAIDDYEVESLIDMMNEAWFLMTQNV